MTSYERPATLEAALDLLALPGSLPMFGGTDLLGQIDRGIVAPQLIVDMAQAGLSYVRADGNGIAIGAATTLAALLGDDLVAPYGALTTAASRAASPLLRNVGTVGGNLCQGTRCWYFRGLEWTCWLGGGDTCYAQIGAHPKHGLRPGDCISAHPSDLAPALAALGARAVVGAAHGTREVALLDLYRFPTEENRSLLTLDRGEIITQLRLPRPPDASAYRRLGERQAFSFALVSVAAARRGDTVSMVAGGVANIPVAIDARSPLDGFPGNPQTGWKRTVLATLADRALGDITSEL